MKAAAVFVPGSFCVPLKGCFSIVLCPEMKIAAQELKTAFSRFWACRFGFLTPLSANDLSRPKSGSSDFISHCVTKYFVLPNEWWLN